MSMPLPTQTLFEIQQKYWPQGDDFNNVTDAEAMERRDRAYHGNFKRWLKPPPPGEPDHNVTDNLCEPIVSTGIDFLLGNGIEFEVTNDAGKQDEDAQAYLDDVWDAQPSGKMPLLAEYEINNAVFGHSFLRIDPNDEDTAPYPSLVVLNPKQMSVDPAPSDLTKVVRYTFLYQDVDPQTKKARLCRQLTERETGNDGLPTGPWYIRDQYKSGGLSPTSIAAIFSGGAGDAGAYPGQGGSSLADPESGWVDLPGRPAAVWPHPWSPIHDGKNLPEPNSYWGKADLRLDIIHLNDILNFQLSNINRILYFHAHPNDVWFGIHGRELDVSPGGSIVIPNINARVQHIEMTGDLAAARAFVEDIRECIEELSHVPSVAVGRLKNLPGIPSGVALEVASRPLKAQTQQKRNLRESVYRRICQHILELGGYGVARKITPHWPAMLPSDSLQEAQTAAIWSGMDVSTDTLQQRNDFDPKVERQKLLEQQQWEAEHLITPPVPEVVPMVGGITAGAGPEASAQQPGQQPGQQQQPGTPAASPPPGNSPTKGAKASPTRTSRSSARRGASKRITS
jgi:hypothetical protein